ncbi:diguanylate cyclase [Actinoplanes sp. CA-131856]
MWDSLLTVASTIAVVSALGCALPAWRARAVLPAAVPIVIAAAGLVGYILPILAAAMQSRPSGLGAFTIVSSSVFSIGCAGIAAGIVDRGWRPRRRHALLFCEPAIAAGWAVAGARADLLSPLQGAYNFGLLVAATIFVARRIAARRVSRSRVPLAVLALLSSPLAASASMQMDGRNADVASLALTLFTTALLGHLARRTFDLLPVAQSQLMHTLTEAVVVLDADQLVVMANPAARDFAARLGSRREPVSGTPVSALLPGLPPIHADSTPDVDTIVGDDSVAFDVRIRVLRDRAGAVAGWTLVARDVTEARRHQMAIQQANEALREQITTNEALRGELAEQAFRDALTGLYNRRYLMDRLDAGRPDKLTLALIDIDHFKQVNDQWGHAAGDDVLRHVAAVLAAGTRQDDLVARLGGEEFVLVMPGCSVPDACARVDVLRRRLRESSISVAGGHQVTVTFSAGVASAAFSEPADLLDAADQALYEAKRSGRDRVVSHLLEPKVSPAA